MNGISRNGDLIYTGYGIYYNNISGLISSIISRIKQLNNTYVSCVIPNGTFGIHRPKLWATIKMTPASF